MAGSEKESDDQQRNWAELPPELMAAIFSRLTVVEILTESAQFVCKSWLEASKDPTVWTKIKIRKTRGLAMDKIFRRAVDRSSGKVAEIDLHSFGHDGLLKYITDRSSEIKRVSLRWCYGISDAALIEAFAKLPLLEELVIGRGWLSPETFEAIGLHCPRLKSLTWESMAGGFGVDYPGKEPNEAATAIGKYIPGLRSLAMIRHTMNTEGLEAILEGCPDLDSLVLQYSANLVLEGEVWERCANRVRKLSQFTYSDDAYDSDDDYDSEEDNYDEKDYDDYDYGIIALHDELIDEEEDEYEAEFGYYGVVLKYISDLLKTNSVID